jgi:outer membrane protein assembly factor BamB
MNRCAFWPARRGGASEELKKQKAKCKIKEIIAALRQFLNFDFLFLIFEFPKFTGTLSCILVISCAVLAADQPQWGERHSRNMVSGETGLAETFDPATGKNIKWVAPLGSETYATPVVAGGRVLIGTNNNNPRDARHKGDRGVLLCLDEKDGSLCWQLIVPKLGSDPYLDWPRAGMVSAPTVEGERVYVVSNRNEVMCLDLNGQANGNDGPYQDEGRHAVPQGSQAAEVTATDADIIWLFDMPAELGILPHDEAHSSILIDGQLLYVNTSSGKDSSHRRVRVPDAPSLIVLDKTTGRLIAKDNEQIGPKIFHCTWSSPGLGEVNGRRLVFFCGGDGVCYAFDALKSPPVTAAVPAPAPAPVLRQEDAGASRGGGQNLERVWRFDCDPTAPKENVHQYIGNREESPSNIKSMPVFYRDRLYVTGGGDIWWGKNEAWLKCIDATKTGDITSTGEIWSYQLERHCCSTPSIYEGLVFVADCGGKIHCVDAETGKPYWTHETKGEIWASTLVADGKVYIGTRRGDFWILAASKDKKVIAYSAEAAAKAGGSIDLDSPIVGSPVAANGVLYIATMKNLYAVKASQR